MKICGLKFCFHLLSSGKSAVLISNSNQCLGRPDELHQPRLQHEPPVLPTKTGHDALVDLQPAVVPRVHVGHGQGDGVLEVTDLAEVEHVEADRDVAIAGRGHHAIVARRDVDGRGAIQQVALLFSFVFVFVVGMIIIFFGANNALREEEDVMPCRVATDLQYTEL